MATRYPPTRMHSPLCSTKWRPRQQLMSWHGRGGTPRVVDAAAKTSNWGSLMICDGVSRACRCSVVSGPAATVLPGLRRLKALVPAPGSGAGNPQRSREASATCLGARVCISLLRLPTRLLAVALTGQRLFDAEFLAGLQVEGVPFDFPNDVLRNDLPLEAAERVLNSLAFLEPYVSQTAPPPRSSSCVVIIRPLRSSEPPRRAPASPSVPCWA